MEHPLLGRYRRVGTPFQMSGTPLDPHSSSPMLGAETDAVLAESGFDAAEIDALRAGGVIR